MAAIAVRGPGAESALALLYERYAASVHGLAVRMVRDNGAAEEVLQDSFSLLWRSAGTYEPERVRFATWFLRTAHNRAVDELRHRGRRPPPDPYDGDIGDAPQPEPVDPEPGVHDQVLLAEQRHAVRAALDLLPQEQRQAVELAYFGGLSHTQIAAVQCAPASTVKTRLALGLKKLALSLGGHAPAEAVTANGSVPTAHATRTPLHDPAVAVRYIVGWDNTRNGYGVIDVQLKAWAAGQPVYGLEHIASSMAETLNERETVRQQRRCLHEQDRERHRK